MRVAASGEYFLKPPEERTGCGVLRADEIGSDLQNPQVIVGVEEMPGAMRYYGLPTVWAPSVEDDIVKTVHKQAKDLDWVVPGESDENNAKFVRPASQEQ